MYLNGGPFPTADRPGLDRRRRGRRRRHRHQLDQLPAHLRPRAGRVGVRARALRPGRVELRRAPRLRLRADQGERRVLRPVRAAPAPAGGVREVRLRLPHDHPQHRPGEVRRGVGGVTSASATPRAPSSRPRRPTWSTRRRARRRSWSARGRSASWSRTEGRRASRRCGRSRSRRRTATEPTKLTVRAPVVVVACGSIESPALLLRSGIGGPAVGDYLRLHPTVAVTAYYDEPQNWMWGPPQAALSHQFADLGDGYGFLIESAQATTGLFGGAIPWRSGADHKRRMRQWEHAAPLIALVRERGHGRVTLDEDGNAAGPLSDRRRARPRAPQAGRREAGADARGGRRARDRRLGPQGARLEARRRPRGVHRRAQRARDQAARVRDLLGAPDGHMPHGPRPRDVGRESVGRAPRHAGRVDRRRIGLPDRVGHQPDGDDHGACPPHRPRDRGRRRCQARCQAPCLAPM